MNFLDRKDAVRQAQQLVQRRPVYLDTETTGLGPNADIVEIAIVDETGSLLFESLVKPRSAMEPDAQRVHKITLEMLQDAPGWVDIWPQIEAVLRGRAIGVYNAEFDLRLMKQSHTRSWLRWQMADSAFFCIMKLYARFYGEMDPKRGGYRNQSLEKARQQAGIPIPNSHRAQDDARLARALLEYIANWKG
mgnify:CR=1 FL=1